MGLTYKLMDDFKFNTTILQNVINTVKGNTDDEFQEHGKTFTSSTSLFVCVYGSKCQFSVICYCNVCILLGNELMNIEIDGFYNKKRQLR